MLITCRLTTSAASNTAIPCRPPRRNHLDSPQRGGADLAGNVINSPLCARLLRLVSSLHEPAAPSASTLHRPFTPRLNRASQAPDERARSECRGRVPGGFLTQRSPDGPARYHGQADLSLLYLSKRRLECKQIIQNNCHRRSLRTPGARYLSLARPPTATALFISAVLKAFLKCLGRQAAVTVISIRPLPLFARQGDGLLTDAAVYKRRQHRRRRPPLGPCHPFYAIFKETSHGSHKALS